MCVKHKKDKVPHVSPLAHSFLHNELSPEHWSMLAAVCSTQDTERAFGKQNRVRERREDLSLRSMRGELLCMLSVGVASLRKSEYTLNIAHRSPGSLLKSTKKANCLLHFSNYQALCSIKDYHKRGKPIYGFCLKPFNHLSRTSFDISPLLISFFFFYLFVYLFCVLLL